MSSFTPLPEAPGAGNYWGWGQGKDSVLKFGCFSAVPTANLNFSFLGTVITCLVFWLPWWCCCSLLPSSFDLVSVFLKISFTVILVRFGEGAALNACVNHIILQWKFSHTFFSKVVIIMTVNFLCASYMLRALHEKSQLILNTNPHGG